MGGVCATAGAGDGPASWGRLDRGGDGQERRGAPVFASGRRWKRGVAMAQAGALCCHESGGGRRWLAAAAAADAAVAPGPPGRPAWGGRPPVGGAHPPPPPPTWMCCGVRQRRRQQWQRRQWQRRQRLRRWWRRWRWLAEAAARTGHPPRTAGAWRGAASGHAGRDGGSPPPPLPSPPARRPSHCRPARHRHRSRCCRRCGLGESRPRAVHTRRPFRSF